MAGDNKSLGRFILDGIPPAPRGVPQVEVTFDIDADGILNVSAQDKATGREQSMQIIPSSGLTDDEVDRMVHDADAHRDQDRQRKELVETRNTADNTAYSAEKFIREFAEQVPADARQDIEDKVKAVRDLLSTDNAGRIRQAAADLAEAMQAVGAQVHQAGGPAAPPPPDTDGGDDQDVIEGEFSE